MVGPGRYKWYQSRSLNPMWGSVPFGPVIPWDTTRTLCLHGGGGCLSHPTSDRRETSWHYISMDSSQPSRRVLKP